MAEMSRDRALELAEAAFRAARWHSRDKGGIDDVLKTLAEIREDLPRLEEAREERDRLKRRIAGAAPDNNVKD